MTVDSKLYAITASRLRDGVVIYYAGAGCWSPTFAESETSPDCDALLAKAMSGPSFEAVGAYAIEILQAADGIRPIGLREEIRAFGPTA